MKLIGRRWAKIDTITAPGYVPKLNDKIPNNLQQGVNQMTYQSSPENQQLVQQQLMNSGNVAPNDNQPQTNQPQFNYVTPHSNSGNEYQNGVPYANQGVTQQYPPEYFVQPGSKYQNAPMQNMNVPNMNVPNMPQQPVQQVVPQQVQQPSSQQYNTTQNESQAPKPITSRTGYTHEYLLENGQIINTTQAYDMAAQGLIEGVMCSSNRGTKYIRMIGDGNVYNNLDDLPEF